MDVSFVVPRNTTHLFLLPCFETKSVLPFAAVAVAAIDNVCGSDDL